MITEAQLAWMAGVLDLKGCILSKSNKTRRDKQYTWSVGSSELVVVRRLCELTASKPEERRNSPVSASLLRRNCIEHCPDAHTHVGGDWETPSVLRWTASGAAFVIVHHNVKPYLQVDRGEQETVNIILKHPAVDSRGSHTVLRRVAKLQSLGWEIPEPYASALQDRVMAALELPEEEAA